METKDRKLETTCEIHGPFQSEYLDSLRRWSDCPECRKREEVCETHGTFISEHLTGRNVDVWTMCPTCQDERARKELREYEEREERARRARQLQQARIPPRFYSTTLDNYKATTDGERRALLAAKDYVESFADHLAAGRCLVFCGLLGTGKTHLACAIAKSLAESGRRVRYFTVQELIRSIRATWQEDAPESVETVLRRLRELDLLVLDEVGLQYAKDAEITQLSELIDLRYRDMKPTLVVSNCTRDELSKYLGERSVDRLRQNGGKVVIFDWQSGRGTYSSDPPPHDLEKIQSGLSLVEWARRDLLEG